MRAITVYNGEVDKGWARLGGDSGVHNMSMSRKLSFDYNWNSGQLDS